jgi:hypothetical protein
MRIWQMTPSIVTAGWQPKCHSVVIPVMFAAVRRRLRRNI